MNNAKIKAMKFLRDLLYMSFVLLLISCTKVLDKDNLNAITDAQIWEDEDQALLYINTLYNDNMPGMSLGVNSPISDETYSSVESYLTVLYGIWGENDIDASVFQVLHKDKYKLIRQINFAIEGLENSSLSDELKNPIIAQAKVLRAMRYFEMVRVHGGVPMVLYPQDTFFDNLDVARSKTSESIDLIVDDLDFAIEWLPVDWEQAEDNGRFTSGAAAAYKGRVLLTWASPLFNRNDDQNRWQRAYDANKQAIELLAQMNTPRDLYPDFSALFTADILTNVESVIFKRYDYDVSSSYTTSWEGSVRPKSGGGSSGYSPTWNLVKAFPMANGKRIDEGDSGYDPDQYWLNRDPRFYATVAYNGCEWSMNGKEDDILWTYKLNLQNGKVLPACGFYCRKATNPEIAQEDISTTSTSWHELRYAEVLLNFAECANEIGNMDEALENIRRIRQRAGIEEGINSEYGISNSVSKDELRQLLMIERQVEFAFENKRYYDIRRRLMFNEDLGSIVTKLNGTSRIGLSILPKSPWDEIIKDKTSAYYKYRRIDTAVINNYVDYDNLMTYFKYEEVTKDAASFDYLELYDFYPIKSSVIASSDSIKQTIGWINGEFDPLAE